MTTVQWLFRVHYHLTSAKHSNSVAEWRRVDVEQNPADNDVSFAQRRRAFFDSLLANETDGEEDNTGEDDDSDEDEALIVPEGSKRVRISNPIFNDGYTDPKDTDHLKINGPR
jgi:hypothetical protein